MASTYATACPPYAYKNHIRTRDEARHCRPRADGDGPQGRSGRPSTSSATSDRILCVRTRTLWTLLLNPKPQTRNSSFPNP